MKLVMICYNEAIDDELMELLDAAKVPGYTKWRKVLGKGQASGPHLFSHIWPKANNVLFTALPAESAGEVVKRVRKMKNQVRSEGLKAFVWQIEEVT